MILVSDRVYWISGSSIVSAPVTGGPAMTHATVSSSARSMVADGTFLYVNDGGSLRRYRLTDFSVTTIAPNDAVVDIALDDVAVYWTSSGSTPSVKKAPK
jgi:hypothetical protein